MESEKEGYTGDFMGGDKRRKDANWFKGTHFVLGGDQTRIMKSQTHSQFRPPMNVNNGAGTYDAKSMTRTHFLLGNEKSLGITTANASYQLPSADFQPSTLDDRTKAELKRSHFNLGGEVFGRYATTNKMDYVPKAGSGGDKDGQEERKARMRRHNFNFGKEGTEFVSTNNAVFQDYSGLGAANMSKKSGSEIGKTHFRLGGESAPMRTVNQAEYREKSGAVTGKTNNSIAFQCTNFRFGDDKVNHMPSSHMHYKYYPQGESGRLNREQLNDLRKEHFIYGKHPNQFKSASQIAHSGYGLNAQRPVQDRTKTQTSSVQLGDPKLATTFFQTTYEVSNQSRPLGNNVFENNTIAKEGSHFQIGDNSRPIGKSQNQATYRELDYVASKPDMDFEKRLRSNHFDLALGNSLPGQYRSVSQAAHDFKGNANEIRSKLETDRKKDLTASHFQVGSDKVKMRSTMKGDYVDNGPSQAVFNEDKKRDLKNSHFMLGDPSNVDFKTSHDINYKWIQPRHVQLI